MSKELKFRLISDLSEEEFFQKLDEHLGNRSRTASENGETPTPHGRLIYGLCGVQSLFNCSHKQAQYYKDNIIQEAVSQNGRKIVVDADLALKLFDERRAKR